MRDSSRCPAFHDTSHRPGQPSPRPSPAARDSTEWINELTDEVVVWIHKNQPDYSWPGNFRELGHCVRSILIRHSYEPPALQPSPNGDPGEELARDVAALSLSAAELRQRYFRLVYEDSRNLEAAAQRVRHADPKKIAVALMTAAEEWSGSPEQADDMTVIVAKLK